MPAKHVSLAAAMLCVVVRAQGTGLPPEPGGSSVASWLDGVDRDADAPSLRARPGGTGGSGAELAGGAEGSGVRFTFDLETGGQPDEPPPTPPAPSGPEPAATPGGGQNEANNPLTPKITLNLHDYYIPSFYELDDRDANQLLLRGVIPHKLLGAPQLFRFTLPIATQPTFPEGDDTGLGDLTLIDWFVIPGIKGVELAVGPVLVAPTATSDALGAGKWQAGVSGIAIAPQEWGILGGLVTFQQSFAGESDRDDVTLLTLQPFFIYNLPEGFYLRSTAIWNFDLSNDAYYIPVGFGVGKVWNLGGGTTLNTFIEPQYTVFHDGVAPQWQVFAGINLQFSF